METETGDGGREAVDVATVKNETTFANDAAIGGDAVAEVDGANDCFVRRERAKVANEMSGGTAVQQREAF